jgi:hypothetical protein
MSFVNSFCPLINLVKTKWTSKRGQANASAHQKPFGGGTEMHLPIKTLLGLLLAILSSREKLN